MKKANCKSGCTSSCPCQCVRPKRRRTRPNAAPRRNPIADLLTAYLTQKLQEGINKPPMFKPVEKKSIGTSTEPVRTSSAGTSTEQSIRQSMGIQTEPERAVARTQTEPERAVARTQTESIETQTIPTNAKPVVEEIVKQRKERIEAYPSDAERTKYNKEIQKRQLELGIVNPPIPKQEKEEGKEEVGALRGEALEELRKKVKGMPKIQTMEDFFQPAPKPSSGGGAEPTSQRIQQFSTGVEKLKAKAKAKTTTAPGMVSVLQTLQEATDKGAEGEQKVEFQ